MAPAETHASDSGPTAEPDGQRSAKISARAGALAEQADDIGAVRKALDGASTTANNLWLAFLSFGTWLAITIASVTHRDILLEKPLKLPILNVELPLVSFFWVAPLVYLIFHAYLLLHLKFLADLVHRYIALVKEANVGERVIEGVREQLPTFIMVQVLAAPDRHREGVLGFLLKSALGITIALGPMILLLFIQLQFLPYHKPWVTWLHRGAIIADLALLWYFSQKLGEKRDKTFALRSWPVTAASFVLISYLSVFVGTFPTERHHNSAISNLASLRALLLEGPINPVTKRRSSWFSNTLVVIDENLVQQSAVNEAGVRVTESFRGRDLTGAVLSKTDLRKADFTGANLTGVNLSDAKLTGSDFGCDRNFERAKCATMTLANLSGAELAGAILDGAMLYGARFDGAQMQGSWMRNARLAGASLEKAQMQAITLNETDLTGAMLTGADLRAATLIRTVLRGASLETALLSGAILDDTDFTGANLGDATLRLVRGEKTIVRLASVSRIRIDGEEFASQEAWEKAREDWTATIPTEALRRSARKQIDRLEPLAAQALVPVPMAPEPRQPWPPGSKLAAIAQSEDSIVPDDDETATPGQQGHASARGQLLVSIACDETGGAPFVAERLTLGGSATTPTLGVNRLFRTPFEYVAGHDPDLIARLLDRQKCAISGAISPAARIMLRYWAEGGARPGAMPSASTRKAEIAGPAVISPPGP